MADNNKNLLNEKLKAKEAAEAANGAQKDDAPVALDDASRVKVLSPARLVAKRFFRNKLAIVGMILLISLFSLSFLGPIFYPYGQLDKFTAVKALELEYAVCGEPSSFTKYLLVDSVAAEDAKNMTDSYIAEATKNGSDGGSVDTRDKTATFVVSKIADQTYLLKIKRAEVFTYDAISRNATRGTPSEAVDAAIKAALESSAASTEVDGIKYEVMKKSKTSASIVANYPDGSEPDAILATKLTLDVIEPDFIIEPGFAVAVLQNLEKGGLFTYGSAEYSIVKEAGANTKIRSASGKDVIEVMPFSIRDRDGKDSLGAGFKEAFVAAVLEMKSANSREGSFVHDVPQLDVDTKQYLYDENGNMKLESETLRIARKEVAGEVRYYASYQVRRELYDIYSPPSAEHILGTDGDGYDVFARIMYGGRISLIVGFVVVILETILGVILGGIAGFFGGWVDTLIMRLVDIFYCIPTMPIMIIIASVFDKLKMPPYDRLMWMMALLGILGWSGIARLVRGQILSLREQEFMIAAEATGLKTSKRIYKHLVPNVMPQLIVSMTMGLGSVILLESTLSYLGLGVKHPLATWGNIINSVSSIEAMKSYVYIWLPVGVLICLAVIAFNFVGDGLRDAFDPKMKR